MSIQRLGHLFRHTHLLHWLTGALVALSVAGCGMHLRPDAPSNANASIAGQWQLQSPERSVLADRLQAVMQQVRDKQDYRERQDARRRPEPDVNFSPPDGDADAAEHARMARDMRHPKWEAREQKEQQDALINAVLPNEKLQIVESANRIEFIPLPGARRRFDKGEQSMLVTRFANLRVESGWQSNVFVVHSRDSQQSIDIVERYQRMGDRLHLEVQLSIPDAKNQIYVANYAPAAP